MWRLLRIVAMGVVFGTLTAAFLRNSGPFRPAPAASAPARPPALPSPAEAKTDNLLRLSASLEPDQALANEYQTINVRHFGGALPAVRLHWEPRLDEVGPLIAEGFRLEGVTNGRVILLHPGLDGDEQQLRRVLCHEVTHVALWDRNDGHGPRFQTLLRRLSAEGAFEGLVATDQEKADLRASLERRSEEMDRESSHLRAAWSELDPADAVRVEEYNSRVRRLQDAAADFNRLVAQYNLMISYPDGLDEARLARRTTPPSTK
jgi:SprT-like family protein